MIDRKQMILEMLAQTPNDPFLQYAYALEIHKTNGAKAAIDLIETLLKSQTDYLGAYYQLGKFYEETQELVQAKNTYQKGMELAKELNEQKTYRELKEALFILSDED